MKHLAIVAACIGLFLVLTHFTYPAGPFQYDEADYMHACRFGLAANYLERPSMPITDYIRTGLTQGRQPGERRALSERIRESNDIPFYRHFHGPAYHYWLLFLSLFTASGDTLHRLSTVFPICTILLLYFGSLWLTPGREGIVQGTLAAAFFGFSVTAVGSMEIAPHHLFVLWSILSLMLLAKMIDTGERRYFYGAAVAAGLAFATLEMALILFCVLAISAVVERRRVRLDWGMAWRSVLLFLGTVLVVWPAAIFKVSFLKAYLSMGYLVVFRRGQSQWGNSTLGQTWWLRLTSSPVEFALIAVSLVALTMALLRGKGLGTKRYLYPYLIFTGLMLVATGTVPADAPRYSLMFMPPLDFIAAAVIAGWVARESFGVVVAATATVSAALFAATYLRVSSHINDDVLPEQVLELVREKGWERGRVVVPHLFLPMIHYYYPEMHLRSYFGSSPTPEDLSGGTFDGVLYPTRPLRYEVLTRQR